ncbi:hypothetical protein M3936_19320 [Sutcliffiella horikoshii]|uniref:hypothetical protein n=1 Tax=Sutcliffiella horikoshii TaxID=79883 RepID=UPI0020411948|nr:hypothetical protein [Sutcliffiella horikoshii]MCM3619724.1 hypothetical protein [Sutcliffiella horikoshii]
MDGELHMKYAEVMLQPEQISMFADIIEQEESTRKVFFFIGKALKKQRSEEDSISGITINDIVENVTVERKTRLNKGRSNYTYNTSVTNIHRKTAEGIADKLLSMSLLYYQSIKPYKFIFLTRRGVQILEELLKRSKQTNTRSV